MTRAALLLLVVLLLASAAGAQETTTTGPEPEPPPVEMAPTADMPFGEFRERRVALRDRTNSIRSDRCRERVGFRLMSWEIHPLRRDENLSYWQARRARALELASRCYPAVMWRKYRAMPQYRKDQWANIHSCEGRWNDTGDPYWGGLQMGRWFMGNYGPDALRYYGTFAHAWPWYVQVVVADRAVSDNGVGFSQWPDCARRFGYI